MRALEFRKARIIHHYDASEDKLFQLIEAIASHVPKVQKQLDLEDKLDQEKAQHEEE